MEIESTFTLQYFRTPLIKFNDLMDPIKSEWLEMSSKSEYSLRVFSPDSGRSHWDTEILKIMDKKFEAIVKVLTEQYYMISDSRYCGDEEKN